MATITHRPRRLDIDAGVADSITITVTVEEGGSAKDISGWSLSARNATVSFTTDGTDGQFDVVPDTASAGSYEWRVWNGDRRLLAGDLEVSEEPVGTSGANTDVTLTIDSADNITLDTGELATESYVDTVADERPVLYLPGATGNYVSTPDHADLDITSDIDLRAAVALDDWTPASPMTLIGKWVQTSDDRQYLVRILSAGTIDLNWSTDGTSGTALNEQSTTAPTVTDGDLLLVRATLDVDNGSGGYDVKFYTKAAPVGVVNDDLLDDTGWTQLGTTVTGGSTTSIGALAGDLEVGTFNGGANGPMAGQVYAGAVLDGIGGTTAANFRADVGNVGPRYRDSTGKVWTFNGSAWSWTER